MAHPRALWAFLIPLWLLFSFKPAYAGPTFAVTAGTKTPAHPYFGVGDSRGYIIDGVEGPELTLFRGVLYTFNVSAFSHPFHITLSPVGTFSFTPIMDGVTVVTGGTVTGFDVQIGTLTFEPSAVTPDLLYYQCGLHQNLGWKINIISPIPGDATLDGQVTLSDFTIWGANYGTGTFFDEGDFNNDDLVDHGDFEVWAANYGAGTAGSTGETPVPLTSVANPEPSTLTLFAFGALSLLAYAHRRRGAA